VIISRDPAPPPATYVATSGGLFRDKTIHDFDMARFFLGEVVDVMAIGANLISDEIAAAGDIDAAVVVLRGARGTLCSITNSRRCAFGYDQRLEAFGVLGMLAAANQLPTSVRFSGATRTEVAPPYHNFFLDRYTPGLPRRDGSLRHRDRDRLGAVAWLQRRQGRTRPRRRREREPADRHDREGLGDMSVRRGCCRRLRPAPTTAVALEGP
jgi:predicted dehydrogenase